MGCREYPFLHLDFVEMPNPGDSFWRRGYWAHWFRPIVKKSTSTDAGMAILKSLLVPKPKRVRAKA